jgi:hypothetical protein
MPEQRIFIRHLFNGGWATDFGPSFEGAPDDSGIIIMPFLNRADNIVYNLDGGPRKMGGTEKINSSALESGADIKGLFDYWRFVGGSATQHRIVHVGTTIKKDDADGVFTNIFTGLTAEANPEYAILEDLLVIASDAGGDVPRSWDGTTAQTIADAPNLSIVAEHKNRMWGAGVPANPSRLHYSALQDATTWTTGSSGEIDISPDDGDRITAIASHQDSLFVFKGPHKGSIHRILGSSPTGFDPFRRIDFIRGVGAVSQQTIFHYGDDLGFVWSDATIRSLAATDQFGDFLGATLSLPINREYLCSVVNFSQLAQARAVADNAAGLILFSLPIEGSTTNNVMLVLDFRFNPPRWARWTDFDNVSTLATVVDTQKSNIVVPWIGTTDGFVKRTNQPTKSIDGDSAINYHVISPYMNYGLAHIMKGLYAASLGIRPLNDGSINFAWTRDTNLQQSDIFTQGGSGSAVLGPAAANQFTLDTSTLGGGFFSERFRPLGEEGGEFRSIQYEIIHTANNEDVEVHSFSAFIDVGAVSTENI